jgi:hypothetical protein
MKIIVTESQLRNIVKRQRNKREMKEDDATTASNPTSSGSGSSSVDPSGEPEGKGADDFPAYPEVDKAEDLVKRGVANPVDYTKKHYEDYPEANPVRGRANPIKGM